jgi:hypothetical protein
MLCRSRVYFAFLVSSLALIVSLGAASEVVSTCSSRYRTPRSHRVIREFDAHGFEVLPEVCHDRNTSSHSTLTGKSKDDVLKRLPAAVVPAIRSLRFEFVLGPVLSRAFSFYSLFLTSIPLSRGPPSA